jgi:hypothetical protein
MIEIKVNPTRKNRLHYFATAEAAEDADAAAPAPEEEEELPDVAAALPPADEDALAADEAAALAADEAAALAPEYDGLYSA